MILRFFPALAGFVAAVALTTAAQPVPRAETTGTTAFSIHFLTNSAGETLVRQGEMAPVRLQAGKGQILNVTELANIKGAQYSLVPQTSKLSITSAQFPGWLAEVSPKQSLSFSFTYSERRIDVAASELNTNAIPLTFSDGARVEMSALAKGRVEVMDDGTYTFFGAGPITGTTADGMPIQFGPVFPPLFGGKLQAPKTTNENARFARASPITQVTFLGQIGTNLSVKVGEKVFPLAPGAAQNITAENGGSIALVFDPATRSVESQVHRGVFRFNIDSISYWKALAAPGQRSSMQWDTNGMTVAIKNKNGPDAFSRSILVNLNPFMNVAVGDSATFQYGSAGEASTFVASAYGGETVLYNAKTGHYTRLDEGNLNVISGVPENIGSDATTRAYSKIRVAWSEGAMDFKGSGRTLKLGIGAEQIFQTGPNQELQVASKIDDALILNARIGNFSITPEILPKLAIELSESAGIIITYKFGADIMKVRTHDSNLSPVNVRTSAGFYSNVPPGTTLIFVINRSPFELTDAEGSLIFSESAGEAVFGAFPVLPQLPGSTDPSYVVQPRVEQPPVTTLE